MPWLKRSSDFPAVAWMQAHLSSHIIKQWMILLWRIWKKTWVPTSSGEGPHICWHFERHSEFNSSKVDDYWHFMKIDRNPNITMPTRKRDLNSHLTSRSVCIVLPSLVYISQVSVIPRQVSWIHWRNSSLNGHPHHKSRIYPRFLPQLEKTHWDFPLAMRWGPIPLNYVQSNCGFPIKQVRSLDLLDWTPESNHQHCHKTRRTLMSPQERKIFRCTQNQIEMRPISLTLAA